MTIHRLGFIFLLSVLLIGQAGAAVSDQIERAKEDQNHVFLLLTEGGSTEGDPIRATIQAAMKRVEKSVMIEIDRANGANTPLIEQFRLSAAPVPLILVLASNGAIAGGLPGANASVEALVNMVPSPTKAKLILAIQDGKSIFLIASRDGMDTQAEVSDACALACKELGDVAVTIRIDLDDKAEISFIEQLQIDPGIKRPVIKVFNPQGQVTASFVGSVEIPALITSATQRIASSCCPVGSGKTCAPKKN